jgi:hypothetical protein
MGLPMAGHRGARLPLLLLFLSLLLSGCSVLRNGRPPGPWHEAYEPIEDTASEAFLALALERAVDEFGAPEIPVNKVLLRRSRKTEAARRYRIGEDFSLTECIDPTNGVFVVYIGVDPDHSNFHALLAHESVHLLSPYITDWYMEGMATVFSEALCAEQEKPWGDWKRHFMRSRRDPYALSYRMMGELKEAFPGQYPSMLRFTAPHDSASARWLCIDIDRWIGSLPPDRRSAARRIIDPYASELRRHTGKVYGFTEPEAD